MNKPPVPALRTHGNLPPGIPRAHPRPAAASALFLASLVIMSGIGSQALAQGAAAMQGVSIQQVAASAQKAAKSVGTAKDAYEVAAKAMADSAAWKNAAATLEGSWKGSIPDEPGIGPDAATNTARGSLSLPVFSSTALSLNITGQVNIVPESPASAGASVSWKPFAVDGTGLKLGLALEQAGINLDAARKEAAISAMSAFIDTISAEASRDASRAVLERTRTALARRQAEAARGELGAAALARARAAVPKAEATYNKNKALAANERRTLAEQTGGETGLAISAGAVLMLESIAALITEPWTPPAKASPTKAVLAAQASLAKEEALSWFGDNSGPLTLGASVYTTGAFSVTGSMSLDYRTLSGQYYADHKDSIASAKEVLDDALEDQILAREQALVDAEIARLSLIEAEATATAANLDLAQAQVLHRLGELLPDELAEEEENAATAVLGVILARLELARARLALE